MIHKAQAGEGFFDPSIFLLVGFLLLMYFLIIRPQNKRAREHREMLAALREGDEVVTSGGLVGTVLELSEQFVMVDVGEGKRASVRVRLQRSAIASVLPKGSIGVS